MVTQEYIQMYPKAMSQFVYISRSNFHHDPKTSKGFGHFMIQLHKLKI